MDVDVDADALEVVEDAEESLQAYAARIVAGLPPITPKTATVIARLITE